MSHSLLLDAVWQLSSLSTSPFLDYYQDNKDHEAHKSGASMLHFVVVGDDQREIGMRNFLELSGTFEHCIVVVPCSQATHGQPMKSQSFSLANTMTTKLSCSLSVCFYRAALLHAEAYLSVCFPCLNSKI